ncbi:MAG: peptidylprolyl isomerase [Blastomonas sp.]
MAGAIALAAAGSMSLSAQTVQDAALPNTTLNVPEALTIYGNNDPNMRKATAVVNNEIITGTDIDQRLALILAANETPVPEAEVARLRLQILRNLIDETLQIQEAAANEIEITDAEVNQSYARVAAENFRQPPEALDSYLVRVGSSPNSLKRQIKGEMAWQRLLGRNVTPFVNVSEEEVNEILERLNAAKGTEEYRLGEIYLSSNPQTQEEVFQNAQQIIQQLQAGGSFLAYARQFSEASTASVGGDLGWIRLEQLPQSLGTAARQLAVGQLAGPIQIPGGFSIIYLIDKRRILTADPRDAVLSLKQLSIEFPPGTTEAQASQKAGEFAQAAQQIRGCGTANAIADQIGATVVDNDQVAVREIDSQPIQNLLLSMSVGQASPPFGSIEEGVRVLVLCGRDDPKVAGAPNFDQVMQTVEDERIGKRAQIYLRDLRRDAVIEYN